VSKSTDLVTVRKINTGSYLIFKDQESNKFQFSNRHPATQKSQSVQLVANSSPQANKEYFLYTAFNLETVFTNLWKKSLQEGVKRGYFYTSSKELQAIFFQSYMYINNKQKCPHSYI
jgi:hypothetical protein